MGGGGDCNTRNTPEFYIELRSCNLICSQRFAQFSNHFEICSSHADGSSDTVLGCATFHNDKTNTTEILDEWDFTRFEFKISFQLISQITNYLPPQMSPWWLIVAHHLHSSSYKSPMSWFDPHHTSHLTLLLRVSALHRSNWNQWVPAHRTSRWRQRRVSIVARAVEWSCHQGNSSRQQTSAGTSPPWLSSQRCHWDPVPGGRGTMEEG